jgi:putative molybdopterin biosynthesis protein
LGEVQERGLAVKALHVGSMGGLAAARREECDIAGIHLMDPKTGEYNRPLLDASLKLVPGYRRMQGLVFRRDDLRFAGEDATAAAKRALDDPACTMINRNAGSGTRILIDRLLEGKQPPGYGVQAKSHNAVATAVAQGRADWGMAIDTVARQYGLGFIPVQEEHYDFVVPKARRDRPGVQLFTRVLREPAVRARLRALGFRLD